MYERRLHLWLMKQICLLRSDKVRKAALLGECGGISRLLNKLVRGRLMTANCCDVH